MSPNRRTPPPGLVELAKQHPGEWLYEIGGEFGPHEPVPPDAIRGGWKVNDSGEIEGDFVANAKFQGPISSR